MRHEVVTRIDAQAELVWRTMITVERWPDWTPTVTEVRCLDEGELRVGSTVRVRQPKQPARTWTVTELRDGTSFTWASLGQGMTLSADHIVTPSDNGIPVATLTFTVSGPLAPLGNLVAGKTIRRYVDTEAASLKAWCEKNHVQ